MTQHKVRVGINGYAVIGKRGADIRLQKSLKEGFGLVVSEGLWKGKPMVAGRAGGIPMQFPEAYQDYLVDSVEDCAARVVPVLDDATTREGFGKADHNKVQESFLLPPLIRDELHLIKTLVV